MVQQPAFFPLAPLLLARLRRAARRGGAAGTRIARSRLLLPQVRQGHAQPADELALGGLAPLPFARSLALRRRLRGRRLLRRPRDARRHLLARVGCLDLLRGRVVVHERGVRRVRDVVGDVRVRRLARDETFTFTFLSVLRFGRFRNARFGAFFNRRLARRLLALERGGDALGARLRPRGLLRRSRGRQVQAAHGHAGGLGGARRGFLFRQGRDVPAQAEVVQHVDHDGVRAVPGEQRPERPVGAARLELRRRRHRGLRLLLRGFLRRGPLFFGPRVDDLLLDRLRLRLGDALLLLSAFALRRGEPRRRRRARSLLPPPRVSSRRKRAGFAAPRRARRARVAGPLRPELSLERAHPVPGAFRALALGGRLRGALAQLTLQRLQRGALRAELARHLGGAALHLMQPPAQFGLGARARARVLALRVRQLRLEHGEAPVALRQQTLQLVLRAALLRHLAAQRRRLARDAAGILRGARRRRALARRRLLQRLLRLALEDQPLLQAGFPAHHLLQFRLRARELRRRRLRVGGLRAKRRAALGVALGARDVPPRLFELARGPLQLGVRLAEAVRRLLQRPAQGRQLFLERVPRVLLLRELRDEHFVLGARRLDVIRQRAALHLENLDVPLGVRELELRGGDGVVALGDVLLVRVRHLRRHVVA